MQAGLARFKRRIGTMSKNKRLWITAGMAIAICILSVPLMETDYWMTAGLSFTIAAGWLTTFVVANIERFAK